MNRVFISYSGSRINRATLFYSLREHGINPWRDVENLQLGDDTTEAIEGEIEHCSGAILWINNEILDSHYVATVELPALQRAWRSGGLRVVPVFDGISPTEASDRLSGLGIEIGDAHGFIVDPSLRDEVTAAAIAARYVRAHVGDAYERHLAPIVRLVAYDDTAAHKDDAILNLDWRFELRANTLSAATEQQLRLALEAATGAVKDVYGAKEITLAIKAHLPLAVALGHAFAQPTGCTIRMPRPGGDWSSGSQAPAANPLSQAGGMKGPVSARTASVEVSVTRNVDAGVRAHIAAGQRYRDRVILTPTDGPGRNAVRTPGDATAWANQIGGELTRVADSAHVDRTHLFLATPVEMAALIGWWTNAAGEIDVMNWTGKTGPYRRMWTLP